MGPKKQTLSYFRTGVAPGADARPAIERAVRLLTGDAADLQRIVEGIVRTGVYGLNVPSDARMEPEVGEGDRLIIEPLLEIGADRLVVLYREVGDDEDSECLIGHLRHFDDAHWHLSQRSPARGFTLSRAEWPVCHRVTGVYHPFAYPEHEAEETSARNANVSVPAPAAAVSPTIAVPAAAGTADVELLALGTKLEQAWSAERTIEAAYNAGEYEDEAPEVDAAYDTSRAIVHQIRAASATTIAGLCVKARALQWCYRDVPEVDLAADGSATMDLLLANGIVRDLLAMAPAVAVPTHGPHAERPGNG